MSSGGYQTFSNANWKTGPGTKFFVRVSGKTNGAHHELVDRIQQSGHVEVMDPDSCDYMLVFCPVASRVGTDVGETVENLPADKDTVLVVMHHTHNRSAVNAESSRLVNKPNIFTVDTLFYEGKLLTSNVNDEAWQQIQRHLRISPSQHFLSRGFTNWSPSSGSRKKFFVHVSGKTNGAHLELVAWIKQSGHVEVMDPDSCDYMLVFCPVASRVGTDVGETVENLPADKDTVLVVMHHTHNRSAVNAESSRLVNKPNIFTVDILFYEGKLLTCDANDEAWQQIQRHLDISPSQYSPSTNWIQNNLKIIIVSAVIVCLIIVGIVGCIVFLHIHFKETKKPEKVTTTTTAILHFSTTQGSPLKIPNATKPLNVPNVTNMTNQLNVTNATDEIEKNRTDTGQ